MPRFKTLTRISHREIRKTAIRPILLRQSGDSGSVTYATVCSLTTHLLFLVLSALSRFLTCAGEKCGLRIFLLLIMISTVVAAHAEYDVNTNTVTGERWAAGVPLGGIGCGKVELLTDGWMGRATINNNFDRATGVLRGAFFAVRASGGGKTAARMLRLAADDEYVNVENIQGVEYTGMFPFANIVYSDTGLPVRVSLEAFSSLVAHDTGDSSLPVAMFEVTVENVSGRDQDVDVLMSWPNLLGYGGDSENEWDSYEGNTQKAAWKDALFGLSYSTTQGYMDIRKNTLGDYFMGAEQAEGQSVSYLAGWDSDAGEIPFWDSFRENGSPAVDAVPGDGRPAGAVVVSGTVEPLASVSFRFYLAWNTPNHVMVYDRIEPAGEAEAVAEGMENAYDGSSATFWRTGRRMVVGDAVVADMGRPVPVKKIVLDASILSSEFPRGLKVSVSDDDKSWKPVLDWNEGEIRANEQLGIVTMSMQPVGARYVKIEVTDAGKNHTWAIGELKIYGQKGNKTKSVKLKSVRAELMKVKSRHLVENVGHYYSNRFASALEVASYAAMKRDRLKFRAGEINRLIAESNLPDWLKAKLANSAFPVISNSVLTAGGRFSVLESLHDMKGALGTMDQRMAAHAFWTMFFPELDKAELKLFFDCRQADGRITHFTGNAHQIIGDPSVDYGVTDWPDLSASWVMQVLKHYRWTGDREFLEQMWPGIAGAMEWFVKADKDGDLIPEGGSTYDYEAPALGAFSYSAGAYLGALEAAEAAAKVMGDVQKEQEYAARLAAVRGSVVDSLWNGEYFIKQNDPARGTRNGNSFIAQLAGDWLARLSGLPRIYDREMITKANESIIRMHLEPFSPVPPMEVTPDGKMATRRCFIIQHEPYAGMESIYNGYVDAGLEVIKRVFDTVWQVNGEAWNQGLAYFAPGGEPEGLADYMTCPATWHVLNALSGISADVNDGTLFVSPRVSEKMPALRIPVFLSNFWLWLDYVPGNRVFRVKVRRVISDDGIEIRRVRADGDAETVELSKPFKIENGAVLDLWEYRDKLVPGVEVGEEQPEKEPHRGPLKE